MSVTTEVKKLPVDLSVLMLREDGYYVAYCPALDVSSYGDSEEEAQKAFQEAVEIFIEETEKKGTLEKVLLKLGWVLQQVPEPHYEPPRISETELFRLMKSKAENIITEQVGCAYQRTTGDHEIWDLVDGSLQRPVVFRANKKEVPIFHIHTNLRTPGIFSERI